LNDTNQVLFEPCGHLQLVKSEGRDSLNQASQVVCKTAIIPDIPNVQCKFHMNKSILEQVDAESSSKLSSSDCSNIERILKSSTGKRNVLPEHLLKLASLNKDLQIKQNTANKEVNQSVPHFQHQISSNSNSNESIKSYYSDGMQRNQLDPSKIVRIKDELIESIDLSSASEHSMQIKQETFEVEEDNHQKEGEGTLIENETDSDSDESINTSTSSSSSSTTSSTATSSADSSTSSSNASSSSSDSSSTSSVSSPASTSSQLSPSGSSTSNSNSNKQTEAQAQSEQMDFERD
jgi:hypothetical protein